MDVVQAFAIDEKEVPFVDSLQDVGDAPADGHRPSMLVEAAPPPHAALRKRRTIVPASMAERNLSQLLSFAPCQRDGLRDHPT